MSDGTGSVRQREEMTPAHGQRRRQSLVSPAIFLVILGVAASAAAQSIFVTPRFDFSFSNPGARSVGFGGAFAALADDATAAYANPAGLVQLTEPEVSLEARQWNRSPSFVAGGRIDGEPTGRGIDTQEGIYFDRDHSQELGPSFASVVIPKGRWSFALYGHQLAKYELSTESQGFFSDSDPFLRLFTSQRQRVDLEVTTAAVATGWRMNDRFSLGLGLVFSQTSLHATTESYVPDEDSEESYFSKVTFLPERKWLMSALDFDDTDVTINAGVLGKVSEQVSGGLFYRQGPEVRGTFEGEAPLFPDSPRFRSDAVFQVPDVLGGGLAWRSRDGRITLTTEVDRVGYAGQLRTVGGGEDDDDDDEEEEEEEDVDFRDTWEYHFGAEYALLRTTPIIAFRAGYWIEKYQNGFVDANDNLTHLSAGIGIAARSYQIDFAADFSDEVNTTSLSFIYTF